MAAILRSDWGLRVDMSARTADHLTSVIPPFNRCGSSTDRCGRGLERWSLDLGVSTDIAGWSAEDISSSSGRNHVRGRQLFRKLPASARNSLSRQLRGRAPTYDHKERSLQGHPLNGFTRRSETSYFRIDELDDAAHVEVAKSIGDMHRKGGCCSRSERRRGSCHLSGRLRKP
jgi:hypothetical protein